ncbi:Na+/H+ antiporter NhaA [Mangrovicoccus sp. HB182678]|uniref:Na(+)/H(+) antiporter NhaA n=2 Tax=Mangrovicoccus algicola TaxID=2771008 RepID=A0A8J7D1B1_9RHOB|nr:Na+/H+ antiporter NhaA [Mangrovicoccus algicola]MBE3640573.1 Na+/H+ antiporter NhaA [Mangrovicoccus algicola]
MERLDDFLHKDTSAGIVLIIATILALLASNSGLAEAYNHFLHMHMKIEIGTLVIDKGLSHWINDGLMAIFFFLVGLEIKRELVQGDLSSFDKAVLPLFAAIGGMAGPAAIYWAINSGSPETLDGWAIPAATDIAFALGILALVGARAPVSLKILLLAIAIIDDLGAIIIIAAFYSSDMSMVALCVAGLGVIAAVGLNRLGVNRTFPYVACLIFVWVCVLKSGVHATLAGVLVALTVPLTTKDGKEGLAPQMEKGLHVYVSFLILPIFAFANAGVSLSGITADMLLSPVPLGIAAGLFFGKQAGVFLIILAMGATGLARLPKGATYAQLYGLACLTGVGFTMSLFIGGLAFSDETLMNEVRLGVLAGSILSGVVGFAVLYLSGKPAAQEAPQPQAG